MRVLLIEDNQLMKEQLKLLLRPIPGAEVVMEASTQAQACEWLARHPGDWDLAIVDLFLTSGNGFTVLRNCVKPQSRQRVIVISNYERDRVEAYAIAAGAHAFYDKETELAALVDFCTNYARELAAK